MLAALLKLLVLLERHLVNLLTLKVVLDNIHMVRLVRSDDCQNLSLSMRVK